MKTIKCLMLTLLFALTIGCTFDASLFQKQAETAGKAVMTADPIASSLEAAVPGYEGLPAEAQKVSSGLQTTSNALQKFGTAAQANAPLAGTYQPLVSTVGSIALGLSAVLGPIGMFIENRKKKKAIAAVATVQKAVNDQPGIGKLINLQAVRDGTLTTVAEVYADKVAG
jgi:hypothetical protein